MPPTEPGLFRFLSLQRRIRRRTDRAAFDGTVEFNILQKRKFFRDETADSLEDQVLQPIIDPIEMGSDLNQLTAELEGTTFYPQLFSAAFGSPDITLDRISKSMSQFIRSMVSYQSKFDSAFDEEGVPQFDDVLSEQENHGREIFHGVGRCSFCHTSEAQVATQPHNNGLDLVSEDDGAGDGRFKVESLRNVGARDFLMHDGRFTSLEEVIEFYSTGIQDNPDLDFRLRDNAKNDQPVKLNFTEEEKTALVAFLGTLTDEVFLTDPKFSNPFELPCDFGDEDGNPGDDVLRYPRPKPFTCQRQHRRRRSDCRRRESPIRPQQ